MSIESILWIGGAVVTVIVVPTVINLLQKQRIQGTFMSIKDSTSDDTYATIVLSSGAEEKEIVVYKHCLERMKVGQYISLIKRKFESIYSLNFIIGEM